MNWHWPQYFIFAVTLLSFVYAVHRDLNELTVRKRWMGLFTSFLAQAIINIPLYFGGFWTPT